MARLFTAASSSRLVTTTPPVTAVPMTIAAMFRRTTTAAFSAIVSITNNTTNSDNFILAAGNAGNIQAESDNSIDFVVATAGAAYSANVWTHACAVFASGSSRSAYINGGNKGTDTTAESTAPAGINRMAIGVRENLTRDAKFDGDIAEVGVWNVALTDAEVAILGLGISPLFVRPASLITYLPMYGGYSPEIDITGNKVFTDTSTAASSTAPTHPRMYRKTVNQVRTGTSHTTFTTTLTATQAQVATLTRLVTTVKTLTATQAQVATLATLKAFGKALTATQAQLATLLRVVTFNKTLSATQAQTATVVTDQIAAASTSDTGVDVVAESTAIPPIPMPYRYDWKNIPFDEKNPKAWGDRVNAQVAHYLANTERMFQDLYRRTFLTARAIATTKVQPWSVELDGLSALATFGILVRNGVGDLVTRRLQAGSGVTITNPSGTSGDPVISAGALGSRTIVAGSAKITVVNGDGVAGNPTIDFGSVASTDLSNSANIPLLNANNHFTGSGDTVFDGNVKPATTQMFSWQSKSFGSSIQAPCDGFVVGYVTDNGAGGSTIDIKTDASNPPTTVRQNFSALTPNQTHGFCCPVRKGDFWKVTITAATGTALYWVPLGTAG